MCIDHRQEEKLKVESKSSHRGHGGREKEGGERQDLRGHGIEGVGEVQSRRQPQDPPSKNEGGAPAAI